MPPLKKQKKQARELLKKDAKRNIFLPLIGFELKLTAFLLVFTVQFICIQIYGNACLNGPVSVLFYFGYLLAFLFVLLPINTGIGTYFSKVSGGESGHLDDLFQYYKKLGKTFGVQGIVTLNVMVFIVLWNLIAFLVFEAFSGAQISYLSWPAIFTWIGLFLLMLVCVVWTLLRFSAVSYVMQQYPQMGVMKTIRMALKLTKHHRAKLLGLFLSFIGWILLSICTAGILFIWLVPYMNLISKLFFKSIEGSF